MLEWVAIPSPGDLPDPGIKLGSPALQADSLPAELPKVKHGLMFRVLAYQIQFNLLIDNKCFSILV